MKVLSPRLSGLKTIEKVSVKDQTLEQLKKYILSGVVQLGERLPSERALADTLGVGRYSVREALKVLEAVGLVQSRVGEGTFLTTKTGASFGQILGLSLATWGGTIIEILDAREMIEAESARAAAERATPAQLAQIERELQTMRATSQVREYLKADMNFHRRIGEASHNAIISYFVNNLIDLLEEVLQETQSDSLPTQAEGGGSHQDIYAALLAKEVEAAGELMRSHIRFSSEVWQTVISLTTEADQS
ncbi:MAG: FadR family transcriptional regulator [Chloroflexi bacterium]|nr:FadR family transcriptional regulator [Chloroflexota bacterium]MYA93370.1 FadR family transcriptional regulator [Chloroflexota bacterium]MYC54656.1 FadR family transcriptional regulator [Chloroflexota bacterium]MYD39786.1 FadR family transcriptional regulator [Chloroflexota bacterium]MYE78472.1 FadR family transcriptional regulator [Chloroflexota bacterium]